jgi:hypothetical protein
MIYWLRLTRAFRFEAGIGTELSTENPECFQERSFKAKLRSSGPFSINSFEYVFPRGVPRKAGVFSGYSLDRDTSSYQKRV